MLIIIRFISQYIDRNTYSQKRMTHIKSIYDELIPELMKQTIHFTALFFKKISCAMRH